MKKKLLTIILSCALAFSTTACGSSSETGSTAKTTETETKTPIEEAVESTKTIGEINREKAAAEGNVEVPEIMAEASEPSENYATEYTEDIISDGTTSQDIDTTAVATENTVTEDSFAMMSGNTAEGQSGSTSFRESINEDLISSLNIDTSAELVVSELPDNFTFDLPAGFSETEDGIYMNSDETDPACIAWFVFMNDGSTTDFSDTSANDEVSAYFEAYAAEMEAEFYNTYGIEMDISLLEGGICEINGKTGFTLAIQYDTPEYGFTMLQYVGIVETPDYIYGLYCMEALGNNYYDDFKACINSMRIE